MISEDWIREYEEELPLRSFSILANDDLTYAAISYFWCSIYNFEKEYSRLMSLCESPIETRLLQALLVFGPEHGMPIENHNIVLLKEKDPLQMEVKWGLVIFPQHEVIIDGEKYRPDFLIVGGGYSRGYRSRVARRVFIECDGHDFHERTKEQAARDRAKDRKFKAAGFDLLRFTGSEIHRKPRECIAEILSYIEWGPREINKSKTDKPKVSRSFEEYKASFEKKEQILPTDEGA